MNSKSNTVDSRVDTVGQVSDHRARHRRRDRLVCVIATLVCLAPFLTKAYHIDDPYYLWIAQHILANPADYYGLQINWYGTPMPVFAMHASPPLAPYVLAAAGALLGWREPVMHSLYLGFAMLFIFASYGIASRLCPHPLLAAMLTLATPVTLVTSTNVMLDLPMTAFFTAGIAVWLWSTDSDRTLGWICAGLLLGLSALTKYFGIAAVPLLGVYMLARRHRFGTWVIGLCIPVVCLLAEQVVTYILYERSVLVNAGNIAGQSRQLAPLPILLVLLTGLSFTGGCLIPVTLFAVGNVRHRPVSTLFAVGLASAAAIWAHFAQRTLGRIVEWELPAGSAVQFGGFVLGGLCLMTLVVQDLRSRRSPDAILLACWVIGTFAFATLINWSVTARSFLPMAPAAAVLLSRELDRCGRSAGVQRGLQLALAATSFVISMAVSWADYTWADSIRQAGRQYSSYRDKVPGTLYFQGHWGFQYYMQDAGAQPVDFQNPQFQAGDVIVIPQNNANVLEMGGEVDADVRTTAFPATSWLAIMSMPVGAGFYSDRWGPLPYAFGAAQADMYHAVFLRPSKSAIKAPMAGKNGP